jgi:HEAT repeat protein
MGLKDFLTAEGRAERSLRKHVARARNKDAQSIDRMASLEALAHDNSPEAVEGLLGRFTIRYDKSIDDEAEKDFVFEHLSELGAKVLPQLHPHLQRAESIAWGLKLLKAVANKEQAWPILVDLCERNDNTYVRDPSKKIQLIGFLGEQDDARAAPAIVPYLEDMDEGVRFSAVEALLHHKIAEVGRDPLLTLLVNPKEESLRIKKRILDGFADLGWDVKGQSGTVEKMLPELLPGGRLDNHGKIKRAQK